MSAIFDLHRSSFLRSISALVLTALADAAVAQQPAPQPRAYYVGNPVGLPVAPPAPGAPPPMFTPAWPNWS